jgi:hypothetical protein
MVRKRKMKKIMTAVLLWIVLCGTAFPQKTSDFEVDADGVITRYNGFDTNVIIPAEIGGKKITAIGMEVFQRSELTGVTIPNGVTSIGESAFYQNKIASISIPNSVTSIGASAFRDNQLTSVTIPDSVTSIGNSAFRGNQLTRVIIGSGVKSIGNSAFSGNKLADLTIPNSVTYIGYEAFRGNQLTRVTIGSGVTSIEGSAFAENQLTSITIPGSVKTIGPGSFNDNPALTAIVLSEGVETINAVAFANTNCTSVSLPSTVRKIEDYAFDTDGKPSFTLAANINAEFPSYPVFYSYIANGRKAGTYAFNSQSVPRNAEDYEFYETQYGAVLTKYTGNSTRVRIPARIGGVAVKALYGTSDWHGFIGIFSLKSLVAVQIPEGITYIGQRTFISNQLISVTIPDSVTYIGDEAFMRNLLASVTIGGNVALGVGNFASFDNDFDRLYNNGGKAAGTYTRDAWGNWTR